MTHLPSLTHHFDSHAVSQGEPRRRASHDGDGSFDKLFRNELAKLTDDGKRMNKAQSQSPERFQGRWMHHLHEVAATETKQTESEAKTEKDDGEDTLAEVKHIATKALDALAARIERQLERAGIDDDEAEHIVESIIAELGARIEDGLDGLEAADDPATAARDLLSSEFDHAAHDLQHELEHFDFGRFESMHVIGGAFRGILPRANAALEAIEHGDERRQVVDRIVDRRIDRMEDRVERALDMLGFDSAEIKRITDAAFDDVKARIDTAMTDLPEDTSPFRVTRQVVRDIAAGIRQEIALALAVEESEEEPAAEIAATDTVAPDAPVTTEVAAQTAAAVETPPAVPVENPPADTTGGTADPNTTAQPNLEQAA